jgi:hypothetical protein
LHKLDASIPTLGDCTEEAQAMGIVTHKHRKKPGKLLKRIRAAVQAGKSKKAKGLAIEFLRSFEARELATRLACRAMPAYRRPDKPELDAIVAALDPWEGSDEEAYVNIRRKKNDPHDYRTTVDFGIENRALQYLLLLPLRELMPLRPNQYGNRGTHAAIAQVKKLMSSGYVWGIEIDIKDCFPNFDGEKVASLLPLPKKVSERVLIGQHLNLIPSHSLISQIGCEDGDDWGPLVNDVLVEARLGIPQGSATSSFLAEALLSSTLDLVPSIGEVLSYLDNILLLAKSKEEVVSMSKALRSALLAHPAGPLKPKPPLLNDLHGQHFEFLGHRFAITNGLVRIAPTELHENRFKNRVTAKLIHLKKANMTPAARAAAIERLRRYVIHWTNAFKLSDEIEKIRAYWLEQIPTA